MQVPEFVLDIPVQAHTQVLAYTLIYERWKAEWWFSSVSK